jgi:hypothetical protein
MNASSLGTSSWEKLDAHTKESRIEIVAKHAHVKRKTKPKADTSRLSAFRDPVIKVTEVAEPVPQCSEVPIREHDLVHSRSKIE